MTDNLGWWIGWTAAAIVAAGFVALAIRSATAKPPTNLGLFDGRLRPCPTTPNCVCTLDGDARHRIEPLAFSGTPAGALGRLKAVLAGLPRARIATERGNYLHVEFTTLIMRFVDDVEFSVDADSRRIHFRSASRVGTWDVGVNRRRMEAIRSAFNQA